MSHDTPTVAAKAIKNIVARWAALPLRAARWLASASRRGEIGEKSRDLPGSEHVPDVGNMFPEGPVPIALRVYTARFYVGGVAVRVTFSPEATVANIHETMPCPDGLEIIMPCEELGAGCFQVQLRPLDALRERAEVADDRSSQKPA